ncbi:MAG: GNAT family N-acetyltransferase [Candidatus Eremiobacteraeota bacterium]|nr:GNAT family N-acetyltransferase [Candidatus Eremiobacteraeota bacterium]
MTVEDLAEPLLQGRQVRLEPLTHAHIYGLVKAADADRSLYQLSFVPEGLAEVGRYVADAVALRDAGTAVPFAIVRTEGGEVIGSTRFFELERWAWPLGHERSGRTFPDVCEIGYTWLARSAIRTGANTEAKYLMLAHAFEAWKSLRVCFHTDERNERSRSAIARIGGTFEGLLRSHRIATDHTPRNSARFSILADEWPELKVRIAQMMQTRTR